MIDSDKFLIPSIKKSNKNTFFLSIGGIDITGLCDAVIFKKDESDFYRLNIINYEMLITKKDLRYSEAIIEKISQFEKEIFITKQFVYCPYGKKSGTPQYVGNCFATEIKISKFNAVSKEFSAQFQITGKIKKICQ